MKTKIIVGALLGAIIIPVYGVIYHYFGPQGATILTMSIFFAAGGALIALMMT
jgi:amino acid permease